MSDKSGTTIKDLLDEKQLEQLKKMVKKPTEPKPKRSSTNGRTKA